MKIPLHLKPSNRSRKAERKRIRLHLTIAALNPAGWRSPRGTGSKRKHPHVGRLEYPGYLQAMEVRAGLVSTERAFAIEGSARGNRKRAARALHVERGRESDAIERRLRKTRGFGIRGANRFIEWRARKGKHRFRELVRVARAALAVKAAAD